MFPSRAPFFRDRLSSRAAEIAAWAEENMRGNLPVSPFAPSTVHWAGAAQMNELALRYKPQLLAGALCLGLAEANVLRVDSAIALVVAALLAVAAALAVARRTFHAAPDL